MNITGRIDKWMSEGRDQKKAVDTIMDFFADNPSPPDSEIHELSDKLGIDTHEFEGYIYSILGSFLGSGRAKQKGFTEKDADPEELKMGIKIETEHTNNLSIAKRITLDHLAEFSDYYTRLMKMEEEAREESKKNL